ncbi:MAG: SPOR domain-containing protein [Alphaproteobacteria bacterium]|nr:SPOR domain-containing protein [Alphaproteobacteria bacterium]NCB49669.1 SPOR domain-containing protein [Alphaproteobacteria bacterium]
MPFSWKISACIIAGVLGTLAACSSLSKKEDAVLVSSFPIRVFSSEKEIGQEKIVPQERAKKVLLTKEKLKGENYFLQLGSFSSPEKALFFFKSLKKYSCAVQRKEPYYHTYETYYRVGVQGDLTTLKTLCYELKDLLQGTCVVHRIQKS